jgi:hypothetical protein
MSPHPARQPIATRHEAEALLTKISDHMTSLVNIFHEETSLVKAGRLREAGALVDENTALASDYLRDIETMKANAAFIGGALPELVEEVRRAHAAFRYIHPLNLRVVATAQSVADGIMRGAADDAVRRDAPAGYGASGRMTSKPLPRPVMLSRSS